MTRWTDFEVAKNDDNLESEVFLTMNTGTMTEMTVARVAGIIARGRSTGAIVKRSIRIELFQRNRWRLTAPCGPALELRQSQLMRPHSRPRCPKIKTERQADEHNQKSRDEDFAFPHVH